MTGLLSDLYFDIRKTLKENGDDHPEFVARYLIKEIIDVADIDFIIRSVQVVSSEQRSKVSECLKRYMAGEPVTRIFGETEFWGLPFKVTPDVLDPRQDSEALIEAAIKRFVGVPPATILDLGTGSGCLIIALLSEWPKATGVAADVSEKALSVAGENANLNGVGERITFLHSNWAEKVEGRFDVIVSNPPYITNREMEILPPEVKNYDPILALSGGEDGLACYRIIIKEIKSLLNRRGAAFLEIGFSQAADVARLVEDAGLFVTAIHPDMAGIPRVVEISSGEK